jgi:flavin reductase (DIM6/NTAB) family NADH-FMN oxidoreductase RutF
MRVPYDQLKTNNLRMKTFYLNDILALDKQQRINLINSLSGIRNACLIGTANRQGLTNVAIFNSVMHIGANPPYMGFIMRPVSVERHTYQNIKETGFFTINHVHNGIYKQAHQTSARYSISEFDATGLTPLHTTVLPAPYVLESMVKIGLRFEEEHNIACNNTLLIVGKVIEVIINDNLLDDAFTLQLETADTVASGGLDTYYTVKKLNTLPYAKP